jgi:hypothetical protein
MEFDHFAVSLLILRPDTPELDAVRARFTVNS